MAEFQNTIDILGDEVVAAAIIDNSISDFSDDTLTRVGKHAFNGCSALTSVNIPNVTFVGEYAFKSCSKLKIIDLPNVRNIESSAFYKCSQLTRVDLNETSFQSNMFYGCSALKTIVIRSTTMCRLVDAKAFLSTPFATNGTGGTAYVPAALIESYQNATNWSAFYAGGTCNFVAIEGSEYE